MDKMIRFKESNSINGSLKLYRFTAEIMDKLLPETDVLISAAAIPGYKAPLLVTEKQVKAMETGSVIIDLAIDQGGSVETSRPTTQEDPVFIHHGIIHYCVSNIPAAVPHTSSTALSHSVIPFILQMSKVDFTEAIATFQGLRSGLNIYRGKVVNKALAETHGHEYYDILELLELNL